MKKFENCEEIRREFVKSGWNKDIQFEEVTDNRMGRKLFKMFPSGNVYDASGKIYQFNIRGSLSYGY